MKKLLSLFCFCCSLSSFASTSITTSSVSGHWSTSGSPYLIFNSIQIDNSATLVIDPGVDVVFQGAYKFTVNGKLLANGTASQPIIFRSQDTTGWWNDATTTGGWLGMKFNPYGGAATDSTVLNYCNIHDTKIDSVNGLTTGTRAIVVQRGLAIRNCSFYNNKGRYSNLINANTGAAGQVFELSGCTIYNNSYNRDLISVGNYNGGSTFVHDNHIYNNNGMVIFDGAATNFLLLNNEIDSNYSDVGTISFLPTYSTVAIDCKGSIRGNKIHHNTNIHDAAIWCLSGSIDITGNLICNNQHTVGTCGAVDGGGAINLSHNANTPMDSTHYIVRNNIIANNYSPFHGGAISFFHAKATVTNNHFINNSSVAGGAFYFVDTMPLICKNNLFYGNIKTGMTALNTPLMEGMATSQVEYNYNWQEHPVAIDLAGIMGGYVVSGDTLHNLIGTAPGIVAPTLTSNVTDNAMIANFKLVNTSPCINKGDTSHAAPYSLDYYSSVRISGSHIDIGAYERFFPDGVTPVPFEDKLQMTAYPNPAINVLFINTPEAQGSLILTDMSGRVAAENLVTGSTTYFDIHSLARGTYIAVWNNASGTKQSRKIVIE